jgi:hypothetical protein
MNDTKTTPPTAQAEGSGAAVHPTGGLGAVERTSRGFEIVKFKDYYGSECSLQASSLAIHQKPGTSAIWLGVDSPQPKCLHSDASAFGVKTDATCGWVDVPLSDKIMLTTRMHLNREQIAGLIAHLQSWLDRDTFKAPNAEPSDRGTNV